MKIDASLEELSTLAHQVGASEVKLGGLADTTLLDGEDGAVLYVPFSLLEEGDFEVRVYATGVASLGYRGDKGNVHVMLHADPLGQVIFHGDMDPLGIDVWIDGHSVIRDTGNYTYNRDGWWEHFKDATAQNTIVVDGLPPWPESACGRWLPAAYCAVGAGTVVDGSSGDQPAAEAWHTGYRRLPQPVTLRRRVTLHPPRGVLIIDTLEGTGSHSATLYFHLGPGRAVRVGDRVRLESDDGKTVAWIWPRSEWPLQLDVVEGWAASGYGIKDRNHVLRVTVRGEGSARVETAVSQDPSWPGRRDLTPIESSCVQANA
jgi:hypothetical protein